MTTTDSAMEKLVSRIEIAEDLLKRAKILQGEKISGSMKLFNKIKSELRFLEKIRSGRVAFKDDYLSSTNLTSLEALIAVIENTEGICEILHVYQLQNTDNRVTVDIVCGNDSVWIKVIARNVKALLSAYEGRGEYGEKSIISHAEQYIDCADSNPCDFRPPKIIFHFCKGVPTPIAERLEIMGIVVEGVCIEPNDCEKLNVSDIELHTRSSGSRLRVEGHEIRNVNLDVTALLCLISNLCYGNCDYVFSEAVLTRQAKEEIQSPVVPKIEEFIEKKKIYACQTAITSFQDIVDTIGGSKEKKRAKELLKRVSVVADRPSERAALLKTSGRIHERSKIIFGTGDDLKAVTITANVGFVRAAKQCGVKFSVFEHQARALTERKQNEAQKI